jgi:hypothetical protein
MSELAEIHYCECNCGGVAKPGRRFLPGHHMRLPEYRTKHNPERYITKVCPYCGEEFQCYVSTQTKYCCQEHYGLDRKGKTLPEHQLIALREANCGRDPWNKNLTKDDDPRIRARGCFKGGYTAWNQGLTKETDERVAKYSKPNSLEGKKNKALASSKRVMEGTLGSNKYYKKGRVVLERLGVEVYYHSSYELEALLQLDRCPIVSEVSRKSIRIQYKKEDGSTHYYVPDLLITTIYGSNYIVEIKPNCFVDDMENKVKFVSAERYAARHNMTFLIWTEDILFSENGVTTALAKVTSLAMAANPEGLMIQSELHSNMER